MKKLITCAAIAALVAGSAMATVKKDWTVREVRDPRLLQAGLNTSFTALEALLLAIDPEAGQVRHFEIKGGTSQDARIDITVNNGAAAGNRHRLLVGANGDALLHQTDTAEAGSYVTQFTMGKDGKIVLKGGAILDNTTSDALLDIIETGVRVSGTFTATGAAALNGGLTMDTDRVTIADTSGNTLIKGTFGAGGGDGTGLAVDADGDVAIARDAAVTRDAAITRNATVGGTLAVTGATTLGNATAGGTLKSTGNFTVGADKLVVTASSGAVVTEGGVQADGIIQSGKDATAGDVRIYPATTERGYIRLLAADAAGDFVTTITRASQAAARTYTIPDAGGAADFVMSAGNQTVAGNKTFTGNGAFTGDTFQLDTDNVTIAAATGNTVINGTFGAGNADGSGLTVDADGDVGVARDLAVTRNAEVTGTLGVTGVVTLVEPLKLTAVATAEAQTLTMTNAPAAATAGKDAPIYIKITVGTTDYVIPAWALAE